MVKRAAKRVPEAEMVDGSAEHLPFGEDSFTKVWSISAYHHWAYPETGIDEAMRVLQPGGSLYLVERSLKNNKTGHGLNASDAEETRLLLEARGYVETSVETLRAGRKDYLVVSGCKPA